MGKSLYMKISQSRSLSFLFCGIATGMFSILERAY